MLSDCPAHNQIWDLLGFILFITINAVPIKPRHFNCRDTIWWDKSGRFGAWREFLMLRNQIFSRRDLAPPQTLPIEGCIEGKTPQLRQTFLAFQASQTVHGADDIMSPPKLSG